MKYEWVRRQRSWEVPIGSAEPCGVVHLHRYFFSICFNIKTQDIQAWNKTDAWKAKTDGNVQSPCFYI